ncbi:MAG: putative zinc metalloprotease Rip3 [Planctomycetota bacterium]
MSSGMDSGRQPWEEPDERTRPSGFGGDWRGSRMTFDDPMTWALPVFRVAGITVRLHLFFFVFVLVTISQSLSVGGGGALGLVPALIGLAALFTIVLLHEFGHAIACRAKGGTADEILIWPLGGLASCAPPQRPAAHLWTAIGGPLVNVGFIAVLTPWIGLTTGQWLGVAIPNPFGLQALVQRVEVGDWMQFALLLTNYVAWTLLLFNLIPMFPLDGGRILQAILWRKIGYAASMRVACRSGLAGAVLIGVIALISESTMLLAIAIFGGFTCFATARQIEQERDFLGFDPDPAELLAMDEELESEFGGSADASRGERGDAPKSSAKASRAERVPNAPAKLSDKEVSKAAEFARAKEAELDRILAKIAATGLESLTPAERATLQRATDEKRDR